MLEEKTEIDKIEIINFNVIQVRRVNTVLKNGEPIASNFIRTSYSFGQDLSGEDDRIKGIAQVIWADKYAAASTQATTETNVEVEE